MTFFAFVRAKILLWLDRLNDDSTIVAGILWARIVKSSGVAYFEKEKLLISRIQEEYKLATQNYTAKGHSPVQLN